MLTRDQLRKIARTRLRDAEVLFRGRRYDGAVYLCGYAVELSLKARICRTLHWTGFPESGKEFDGLRDFKTHNLDLLLKLAGREASIKKTKMADWSIVVQWDPESRYKSPGAANRADARSMLDATRALMGVV